LNDEALVGPTNCSGVDVAHEAGINERHTGSAILFWTRVELSPIKTREELANPRESVKFAEYYKSCDRVDVIHSLLKASNN